MDLRPAPEFPEAGKAAPERYVKAKALFEERCETVSVVVKRTVKAVKGIELRQGRPVLAWGDKRYFDSMADGAAMVDSSNSIAVQDNSAARPTLLASYVGWFAGFTGQPPARQLATFPATAAGPLSSPQAKNRSKSICAIVEIKFDS